MKKLNLLALLLPLVALTGCNQERDYYKITFKTKDGDIVKYYPTNTYPTLEGWKTYNELNEDDLNRYSPSLERVYSDATYVYKDYLVTIADYYYNTTVAQKWYAYNEVPKSSDFGLDDTQFYGGNPGFAGVTGNTFYFITTYKVTINNVPGYGSVSDYFQRGQYIDFTYYGIDYQRYSDYQLYCTENASYNWRYRIQFENVKDSSGYYVSTYYGYADSTGYASYSSGYGSEQYYDSNYGRYYYFDYWQVYDLNWNPLRREYGFYTRFYISQDVIFQAYYYW